MNAVSLNAPNPVSPAALSPAALAPALSQGPTAGGGFIDLISLLLATVSTDTEPSAATPGSSSDAASSNNVLFSNGDVSANLLVSPQVVSYKGLSTTTSSLSDAASQRFTTSATPDQIASVLIRFMTRAAGTGTPAGSPQTDATKKASSDQKSARIPNPASLPLLPVDPVPITPVGPQPCVVTIDPQLTAQTISIPSVVEPKTETISGPAISGPVFGRPPIGGPMVNGSAISGSVADRTPASGPVGPASPVSSFPDPSFPNLKLSGTAPSGTTPVAFRMQLTPVASQEIPDPQTTPDVPSLSVPQNSAASEICPEAESDTDTPKPAPSTSEAVSSPVLAATPTTVSSTMVFKGSISNEGENQDETKQGSPGFVTKPLSEVTQEDQTKQGSGEKSGTDSKSGAASNAAQDPQENTAVATAPSAPVSNQIQAAVFPTFHAPAPPQSSAAHAGAAGPKVVDQPAAPQLADAKDILATPPASSGRIQQIDVRISQPQTPPVDLQVSQKSGQIQVVVRTADAGLETALRQDLGTLVHSLERSGFQAETFIPNASESSRMNSQGDTQPQHQDSSANGPFERGGGQGSGQNQGRNHGRGSGGNSRGNASRDPEQFEAWTDPQ